MSRILFEAVLDASGAITGITRLKEGLAGLGTANTAAARDAQGFDRDLTKLVNRLEPARVATEKLQRQQELLTEGFNKGKIAATATQSPLERYHALMGALATQQQRGGNLATDFANQLKGMALQAVSLTAVLGGLHAAFRLGVDLMRDSITTFTESEAINAKLEAVYRATGGAAGFSVTQLDKMASAMSKLTGIDDEAIKSGQTVLQQFTAVRGQAFEGTIKAALDVSKVMGGDVASAAEQLGRALEKPTTAGRALRSMNIVLSESEEKLLKTFEEQGRTAEAQALILERVQGVYAGVAEELRNNLQGQLEAVTTEFDNLKEAVGGLLVSGGAGTVLNDMALAIRGIAEAISKLDEGKLGVLMKVVGFFTGISGGLKGLKEMADAQRQIESLTGPYLKQIENELRKRGMIAEDPNAVGPGRAEYQGQLELNARQEKLAAEAAKRAKEEWEGKLALIRISNRLLKEQLEAESKATQLAAKHAEAIKEANAWAEQLVAKTAALNVTPDLLKVDLSVVDKTWTAIAARFRSKEWQELSAQLSSVMAAGMTDGILAAVEGESVGDALKGLGNRFAAIAGQRLDLVFSSLLAGKSGREALQAAGLVNRDVVDAQGNVVSKGGVNWGGVAQMGGGLLMSYGQQRQNRGAAMVGGAVSGAVSGYMAAGAAANPYAWVGAVIGAIIGAAMGYISTQSKKTSVKIGPQAGGRYLGLDVSGIDNEAEAELARTWIDKTKRLNTQFREIYRLLEAAVPDFKSAIPTISTEVSDFSSWWKALIERTLPDALFNSFRPGLEAALKGMGVGDSRVTELMSAFAAGNFDAATAQLLAYIQALIALKAAATEYGKDLGDLRAEANQTPWEDWTAGLVKTSEQIGKLLQDLPKLTSEEQVARAQELLALTQQQYQANLKMFHELEQMRTTAAATLSQYVGDRNLATAQRGGWGASDAYLRQGFGVARATLNEAAIGYLSIDPQAAQRNLDDAFRYGQALSSLADAMEAALPDFDALLTQFNDFNIKAAVPLADVLAKLGRGVRQAFIEDSTTTIARITSLRQGLDKLAPADYVARMQQIGQLQEEQYTRQLEYVKALASAQKQLNDSIDAQLQNITENELAKQGKDVIGQYYVDQMKGLWEQLQAEKDPMKAKEMADRILEFSQKLYGLDPDIMLKIGDSTMGAGSWLTGFLGQLRSFMNGTFETAGDEAQTIADQLLLALGGLTTGITTKKDELQASIDAIRKFVDEGLAGAVADFNAIIQAFQQSIVDENTGLQAAINAMVAALTGASLAINTLFGTGVINPDEVLPPGTGGPPGGGIDIIPIVLDLGDAITGVTEPIRDLTTSASGAATALGLVAQRLGNLSNLTITISVPDTLDASSSDPQLARIVRRNRGGVAA